MTVRSIVQISITTLSRARTRALLTVLGIVIGVASIVTIVAVGEGAQRLVLDQINRFGSNLIGILPGASEDNGPPATTFGITVTTLKNNDLDAIRASVAGHDGVSGYVTGIGSVSYGNKSIDSRFTGVSAEYPAVEDVELAQGEFFVDDDDRGQRQVAVLGWSVYTELFGTEAAVGSSIKIKGSTFRVVGVAAERGTAFFQNQDDQIFVPLETAQKRMLGINHVSFARMKSSEQSEIPRVIEDVKTVLRDRHGIESGEADDFSVRNTAQALEILGTLTDTLKFFLAAVAALSLVVGGIGIMNIMLVSVLERRREIGLRKAVGARSRDIRVQFLSEAVIICLCGGLIGLAVGLSVSYVISIIVRYLGYAWEFRLEPASIVFSVVFPVSVGLIFGYYPASRAARLNPIEALRYE